VQACAACREAMVGAGRAQHEQPQMLQFSQDRPPRKCRRSRKAARKAGAFSSLRPSIAQDPSRGFRGRHRCRESGGGSPPEFLRERA
jgi:hypothetical protein